MLIHTVFWIVSSEGLQTGSSVQASLSGTEIETSLLTQESRALAKRHVWGFLTAPESEGWFQGMSTV